MVAAAELGRNPVSKHQIQPEYGDEQADAGQGNIPFSCSADHEQDWQPYPVDPYFAIRDDHTYIHTYIHICHMPRWQPYVRLTKTGRRVVMATDASYLENIHAQAILELQAGFRPGFAPCLQGKSFQDTIYLFDYLLF